MYLSSKKGVQEIVSYVLLTLLVLVASLSAYVFSKTLFQDNLVESDTKKMHTTLKKIHYEINRLLQYDGSSSTVFFRFESGQLEINSSTISFLSLQPYVGDSICFDVICYSSRGGYELSFINFSGLTFDQNISVRPGDYQLQLTYNKSGSQINIAFK
jgi:hypothetical protein